jgi:hypothetical protein
MDEVVSPMKTKKCQKVKGLMALSEQGTLSPDQDLQLRDHLSECSSCSRLYQETLDLLDLVRRDRLPDREPAFWKGMSNLIMAEVRHIPGKVETVPWYRKIWGTPFQWPGYAWATALLLFILTPLAIYTIQDRGKTPYPGMEMAVSQLRGEFGFEPYLSALESFSAKEADRLGTKVLARLEKELAGSSSRVEEELSGDLPRSMENLNPKELDALFQKLQTRGALSSKEEKPDVA